MTEHAQEEGVVLPRAFDFLAQGCGCRVAAHQIEGELSEYREVLGRVVLRVRLRSSLKTTSSTRCSSFSMPQWERTMRSSRLAGIYLESRK